LCEIEISAILPSFQKLIPINMNKSTETKLLLGAGMLAGAGIFGIVEYDKNNIQPSANDCRELQKVTGTWWNEDTNGWRNEIRKKCSDIIFEDEKEKTGSR
jgi:hypothetical protein